MTRFLVFSLILLTCCQCAVPKPDTDLCIINAPAKHLKCYNLSRDYDDNGNLIPGAPATFKSFSSLEDVNKFAATDPEGLAHLKAYIKKLREQYQNSCPGQ